MQIVDLLMTHPVTHNVSYAISPWNVPLALTIRAVSVPIICGNTVVLKTSESSPRSQTLIAELLKEVCPSPYFNQHL